MKTRWSVLFACLWLGCSVVTEACAQEIKRGTVPTSEFTWRLKADGTLEGYHPRFGWGDFAGSQIPTAKTIDVYIPARTEAQRAAAASRPAEVQEVSRPAPTAQGGAKPDGANKSTAVASGPVAGPGSHTGTGGGKGVGTPAAPKLAQSQEAVVARGPIPPTAGLPAKAQPARPGNDSKGVVIKKLVNPPAPNNPNQSALSRHKSSLEVVAAVNSIGDELVRLRNNLDGQDKVSSGQMIAVETRLKVVEELLLKVVESQP